MEIEPYTINTLHYEDGIFDEYIDATYIIHLKDNGRETHIFEQLSYLHPTNVIHIVYNEGFKKCYKGPNVQTTVDDLTHTYLWTFKHAFNAKYRNILIFEDDFIFNVNDIKNPNNKRTICDILESRKTEDYVFLMGCLPFMLIPRDLTTYTGITCGMHCAVYSEQCIRNTLSNRERIKDWDIFFNFVSETTNKYVYPSPLCYQLFPVTENSTNWGNEHIVLRILTSLAKPVMKLCSLDKQVEPGYSIFYIFSKILGFLLIGIVAYVIAVHPFLQIYYPIYDDFIMRSNVLNTQVSLALMDSTS